MFKFVTIYRRVDDPEALENFFSQTHLPLAERLPGLIKSEMGRVTNKPGGQSRFHMIYELYFETKELFEQALTSNSGLKLMEALKPWVEAKIITWFYADAYEEGASQYRREEGTGNKIDG